MRLTVARLRRVSRRDFSIQFGREQLSSYGGLELLRRFFALIGLKTRIQRALATQQLGGDYGASHLVLLVIGLLIVGARRLSHLRYVANDPLFARLCGLSRIPTDRTVVNWLKQFTQTSLHALMRLNRELLYEQIEQLKLPRLTIDLDGTVICTGAKVAWAGRGFNPHHRKASSYYPLLAHLAQTGQILRLKNRPGNVHDSKGADVFVRQLITELRERLALVTAGIPHGCGLLPAKPAQAAAPPRLLLCGQGALLQVDRGQSSGRRAAALERGRCRYRLL
jgi:hypothetical protein